MVGTVIWFEALCFVLRKLTAAQQVWVVASSWAQVPLASYSQPSEAMSSLGLPSFHCALTGLMVLRPHPLGIPEAGHSLTGLLAELRGRRSLEFN